MNQPLATYRYTLTWQDALAYERLPRSMRGIQQATLYIWLALSGVFSSPCRRSWWVMPARRASG